MNSPIDGEPSIENEDLSREISVLKVTAGEKEDEVAELKATVAEKEREVAELKATVAEKEREVAVLKATVAEKEREVAVLKAAETVREQVEQRLTENMISFRLLFTNNPRPMWVLDRETLKFLEVNESAVAMYGYSREEFLSMQMTDVRALEALPRLFDFLAQERRNPGYDGEWKHRLKNGQVIDVEISSHSLPFAGRDAILVVAENITSRRQLQQQLLQSQKMDILGRLASGLTHDFNNSLTAIMGFSGLAELELPYGHAAATHLQHIQQAAAEATELLHQLLAFARRQSIEPQEVDINGLFVDADQLLRHLVGEHIELVIVPKPGLGHVRVDPIQIKQVLINLADYARTNMPNGGRLLFETDNVTLNGKDQTNPVTVIPGDYVLVKVTDNGLGLNTEEQVHIFDPFFASEETGAGMRLGLATCYGIIKQSGGYIWVDSEPGKGIVFRIYLPRVGVNTAEATHEHSSMLPRGTETILVVDDDPLVRSTAIQTLRTLGYTVLEATNGREALRLVEDYTGTIDLLLTDIVMPHIGGAELVTRLRTKRQGLRILYISGYLDQPHATSSDSLSILNKPFTISSLTGKVREVLDAPGGSAA